MYHCHIRFCLTGHPCREADVIKRMPPMENFTHEFAEIEKPLKEEFSKADVVIANLRGADPGEILAAMTKAGERKPQVILLAEREQLPLLREFMPQVRDIWIVPMSDVETVFRFARLQEMCKLGGDFWQTSHFLEATIDNIPNLVWYKDKDGVHEKVNDSFCKAVNKTKRQVQGQRHAYIWDVEEDDPACIESEAEVMTTRKTCISEETIKTGDGNKLLAIYKSPLYDMDDSVMGTVGVAIDITQERAYEQEIVKKNQTLETIFTTIDCGVMRHSVDGKKIFSINRAALKILGYECQEEMEADGFDMVAHSVLEEDKPKLRSAIRSLKREGDSVSIEYRVRHADGEILHIMGNVKLLKENRERFYQRFLLDCTAQKLQEKKNEKRHSELIQALTVDYSLVCVFDLDTGAGNVLREGEGYRRMFGSVFDGNISLEGSIRQYIDRFVHEDDKEMMGRFASLDRLKAEMEGRQLYYVNYRAVIDGDIKYFQVKAVRTGVWGGGIGVVLGFRSVDEDIRREMKKNSLLEDALSQARKASRAKSAFLSNMSHDIRTPMNAIVGFTSLAMTRIDSRELVEEYLKKIMTSGNHLLNLINDVLDMSRIESGKMRLDEKPCNLPEFLCELENILQSDVRDKDIRLEVQARGLANPDVYCDSLRLNQVLLNLLSNSVKYTERGGRVTVDVIQKPGTSPGHGMYDFVVSDTGIGMSAEFVEHIFEPFERELSTTLSGIPGTGLGMAITKNIVDKMNGYIEVKSQKGVGTQTTVTFEMRFCSEEAEDTRMSGAIHERVAEFEGCRILLAEDNELNQEIAVAILEEAGFCVEVADNGKIAVDMLKRSQPGYYRLILMDVQMPVMDGYGATKVIRSLKDKELSSIPILAMTANAFEEDKQEALRCGMNGHIAKPIDVGYLFETLNRVLA